MMNIRELKPEDMDKVSGGVGGAPGVEEYVRKLAKEYKGMGYVKEKAIISINAKVKMIDYDSIVRIVNEVYGN